MTNSVQLIVGLGNPGSEYESTRHNAGAFFVHAIAQKYGLSLKTEKKFHGLATRGTINGHDVYLLIPTTFMNRSGLSVAAMMQFYKITPDNILIAHDELDLAPGIARLKIEGGHGGHNGLRDIIAHLGVSTFGRLRLGIGRPAPGQVSDFVLSRAPSSEQTLIDESVDNTLAVLPLLLEGDWAAAMNQLHSK